ncbi:uncharacterized protein BYT42DRAFT_571644 [Radiomyces spectabilis]|uniref:uncharacterized protein n=1 Tax=Radiomyces spectabilis TaxID=64574 RepID=UPI0022208F38|nr:uncharacterized protein BYT42DRAFT_571644 [Radiomyces spectabilis]KAI8377776.1 hypothetical protein BYT42DRAFT_571644 [Radiomyces spectabilis]
MDLQTDNCTLEDLFTKTNYWIDITSPSTSEMKLICKIFRIHPLTVEDIMSQEIREKCDVFRNYLFICYRAFVHDDDVLKPISFYNIVSKRSIVSIHYGQVPHVDHVQRRVDQLQGYIMVIPDWINYAIMDEITDSFAPIILQIESEVDAIDDLVLLLTSTDQSDMVSRIGSCRKRVMQMLRLLGTKADVVRTLIKRYEERSRDEAATVHHVVTGPTTCCQQACAHSVNSKTPTTILGHKKKSSSIIPDFIEDDGRILPDVGLYLGDVQDHILMMLQNLNHYETVLARSHSNYLARISIELTQTSNSTNHVIGRLTIFATVLLPMNLVTGLWGMNVKVPGKDVDNLIYFFWIVCSLAVFAILSLTVARRLQFF